MTYLATTTNGSDVTTTVQATVVVPHDQGGVVEPITLRLEQTLEGTVASWNDVPGAVSYDVIRGDLSNIVETRQFIELGPVVCVESRSTDTNTSGAGDMENPPPGGVFFYTVAYNDDLDNSSHGTESAARPRAITSGQCE